MKLFFFSLIGAFFLMSCSGESEDDLKDMPNTDTPDTAVKLTFENDIKPLVEGRCLKCHGMPTRFGAPAGAIFVSFDQVNANADKMFARINNGTMPPASEGALSSSFVETFEQWIKDGKLEK
ncbi:hypothetical protein [Aquimarina agarilytica]|uniref:hypothetical protein n=1 Tax=Aquimarina agarilytica TaxID=1087449 RepID=UPI000289469A|nr:hypothetical protein [Aquimarina agarilytica]